MSTDSKSCGWSNVASKTLLGAVLGAALVFTYLVVTHKESSRGHF